MFLPALFMKFTNNLLLINRNQQSRFPLQELQSCQRAILSKHSNSKHYHQRHLVPVHYQTPVIKRLIHITILSNRLRVLIRTSQVNSIPAMQSLRSVHVPLISSNPRRQVHITLRSPYIIRMIFNTNTIGTQMFLTISRRRIITFTPPTSLRVLRNRITSRMVPLTLSVRCHMIILTLRINSIISLKQVRLRIQPPTIT